MRTLHFPQSYWQHTAHGVLLSGLEVLMRHAEVLPGEAEAAELWKLGKVDESTPPSGALVGGLMLALGWRQQAMAEAWGVQPSTLVRWRYGHTAPPSMLAWWGIVAWARRKLEVQS